MHRSLHGVRLAACAGHVLVLLSAAASPGRAGGDVVWRHAADHLDAVNPGPLARVEVERAPHLIQEGLGSIRAIFPRGEALHAPPDWNQFFRVRWTLPRLEVRDGDRLRLHYRMNRIEAYYPSLTLRLVDARGNVWNYPWSQGEGRERVETAGLWLDVDIDLFADRQGGPERLDRVVALEAVANNRAFRAIGDYIRWFDDLRIVRPSGDAEDRPAATTDGIEISNTPERFPVDFVSTAADLRADAVLMGPQGGFAANMLQSTAREGQPWEFLLAARLAEPHPDPQRYQLRIRALDADGAEARAWVSALKLEPEPVFHRVRILPRGLPPGRYSLRCSLESGQAVMPGPSWPVELTEERMETIRADLTQRIRLLRDYRNETHQRIARADQKAREPSDYDRTVRAAMDLFLPMASRAVRKEDIPEARHLLDELERIRREAESDPRPFSAPAAFRPDGSPVEIRGGSLIHRGRRIFMIGFTSDYRWHPEIIADLGFNAVHSNHPMRETMPEPAAPVPPPVAAEIRERYQTLLQQGLFGAVVSLTAGTPPPDWMAGDPDMSRADGHFIPYCIEDPKSDRIMEARYRELLKVLSDVDNAVLYLILNEPAYEGRTPEFQAMARDWLAGHYGDIATLNEAWGSEYADFDAIPAVKLAPEPRARYDWAVFNRNHLTGHARRLHEFVQSFDPRRRPTHVKLTSQLLRDPAAWSCGADWEQVSRITDMVGYDSPHSDEPMMLDLMRSMDPGKPVVNSETHLEWFTHSAPWIQQWRMAARGCAIMLHWQWLAPERLRDSGGYPTRNPYSLWRAGRAALDIQRLADPLEDVAEAPPGIAILHTLAAMTFEPETLFRRVRETHDALQYCGAPVRFVTHEQLERGELANGIRLVIAAGIRHTTRASRDALEAYTRRGGLLVAIDSPMDTDVGGRPLQREWPDPGRMVTVDAGSPEWQNRTSRFELLDHCLDQAGVPRPVRLESPRGGPAFGIDYRVSASGRWLFAAPVDTERDTVRVRFRGEGTAMTGGVDLVRGQRIPMDGEVDLRRHQAYLIDLSGRD